MRSRESFDHAGAARLKAASAGTATFTGCAIDRDSSVPYALVATLGNHAARSQNFTVSKGAPVSAEFTTDPGSGNGGLALASQPVVVIRHVRPVAAQCSSRA